MTLKKVMDIEVDVCEGGCGGIWFDGHELKKVDEAHEAAGQHLLEVAYDPEVDVDESQRRECPRCDSMIMMRHFSSIKREVEVDECPGCAGFFLDRGELNNLRNQYQTEEDRKEAAINMFGEMFDEDMDDIQDASWQQVAASKRLIHMFRFFLPSYYLKGKQKWGAY
ncbi:MAG: zf-TFIIB domain-containing protein [bacterium]|nr:zf-TFIIB domain-containing protein [bacterium]